MRSNNGVVGGGSLTVETVGFGLLRRRTLRGVGGRFESRDGPAMGSCEGSVGVESLVVEAVGKRYEARYVSKRERVFIVTMGASAIECKSGTI